MRSRLWLILLILAAASASAALPLKAAYRITGVAVSARDGAPVPYCRMQISDSVYPALLQGGPRRSSAESNPGTRAQPTEVDADVRGHFEFTLDHPGAYVVTGSARGYRRQNFDEHEHFFSSIVLTPAVPAANITFRMERDASITGLILDEAGEAVRNAQVAAEVPGQLDQRPGETTRGRVGRQAGFAQTDDRGRYEMTGLTPGAYRIRVTAQPWYAQAARSNRANAGSSTPDPSLDVIYPTQWFPGVYDDAAAETLTLSEGEERQADFHMTPLPAAQVVVSRPEPPAAVDGQPQPLPMRNAILTRVSPAGGGFTQSTTNGTTVEFMGLAPGLYELHTIGSDGRPEPGAKQFRVVPGSSGVVDISSAVPLTKVRLLFEGVETKDAGQVSFVDSVTGRTVVPENQRRRNPDPAAEQERAVYLSAGKWEVHLGTNAASYLIGLRATGATVNGSTIAVGDDPATLTLQLGTGRAEISGFALAGTKPVEGAMVLLVPATLGDPGNVIDVQRDQTNTDGSFNLRGVAPGRYILLVIDRGWPVKWKDLSTLAGYLAKGKPLDVAPRNKMQQDVQVIEP